MQCPQCKANLTGHEMPNNDTLKITREQAYGGKVPPIPQGWEDAGLVWIEPNGARVSHLARNGEVCDALAPDMPPVPRIMLRRKAAPRRWVVEEEVWQGSTINNWRGTVVTPDGNRFVRIVSEAPPEWADVAERARQLGYPERSEETMQAALDREVPTEARLQWLRKAVRSDESASKARIAELENEIARLREASAVAYQFCGALGANSKLLDNLSALAGGEPQPHAEWPIADGLRYWSSCGHTAMPACDQCATADRARAEHDQKRIAELERADAILRRIVEICEKAPGVHMAFSHDTIRILASGKFVHVNLDQTWDDVVRDWHNVLVTRGFPVQPIASGPNQKSN